MHNTLLFEHNPTDPKHVVGMREQPTSRLLYIVLAFFEHFSEAKAEHYSSVRCR